jgi:hypothetical protein
VYTPGQPYKGSMTTSGEHDDLLPERPTRQCVSCFKEYERNKTHLFKPLGVFHNYCICESCLDKDRHGWGVHQ